MPNFKEPLSLRELSCRTIGKGALLAVSAAQSDQFSDYFANKQPTIIVHQIMAKTVDMYIDKVKCCKSNRQLILQTGDGCLPSLHKVYSCWMSPAVTHLDFSGLVALGTVTPGTKVQFNKALEHCLKTCPALEHLNLRSPNYKTSLPSFDSPSHLKLIGTKCQLLKYLDLSFISGLMSDNLVFLIPSDNHSGCPDLRTLNIFDCGISDKTVKQLVSRLPNLNEIGYKEIGRVLTRLKKENFTAPLKFTHLNCIGEKMRKTSLSSLRCKEVVANAISLLCPNVTHLKVRVQDEDVTALKSLDSLLSVEFLFNVGKPTSPFVHTMDFLKVRGLTLTSVALICYSLSMLHIECLGKECPNLNSLWLRCNYFNVVRGSYHELPSGMSMCHGYFKRLGILYFRVGEGELSISNVPSYVLHFMLKNCSHLRELILAVRSSQIDDSLIRDLVLQANLRHLEKVMIVVPGLNNLSKVLSLTLETVKFMLDFCPYLKKLGNLISWDVDPKSDAYQYISETLQLNNYDIDLVCRNMVMH